MSLLFEAVEPMTQVVGRFQRNDEDGVDKLNHRYGALVFVVLSIIVTTNQYVGEVIKCLSPAEYPESWVEYAHSMCWISNTYYVPMEITNVLEAPKHVIVYYQWVPLLLLLQALIMYTPGIMWFLFNRSTGIDINKIVSSVRQMESINPDHRDKTIKFLVKHIDRSLACAKQMPKGNCQAVKRLMSRIGILFGKRYGNYLTWVYMVMKLVHIGSMFAQMYMLNKFLGTNYTFYGIEVLRDLSQDGEFPESEKFPRVTLCDFTIRKLGQSAKVTVQCTLPINIFNEKIFTFIWFFLFFLLILNVFSLLSWISTTFPHTRVTYVKKYLKVFDRYDRTNNGDKYKLMAFCDKYLRMDGYFALRMISHNTNEVVIGELITALWDNFLRQYDVGKFNRSMGSLPSSV